MFATSRHGEVTTKSNWNLTDSATLIDYVEQWCYNIRLWKNRKKVKDVKRVSKKELGIVTEGTGVRQFMTTPRDKREKTIVKKNWKNELIDMLAQMFLKDSGK